jgi:hypothetical protein
MVTRLPRDKRLNTENSDSLRHSFQRAVAAYFLDKERCPRIREADPNSAMAPMAEFFWRSFSPSLYAKVERNI